MDTVATARVLPVQVFLKKRQLKSKVRGTEVASASSDLVLTGVQCVQKMPDSPVPSQHPNVSRSLVRVTQLSIPQLTLGYPAPSPRSFSALPCPSWGSHLLALQLQDAAEGIAGLRELLHLLLLCLAELEREQLPSLSTGALRGGRGWGTSWGTRRRGTAWQCGGLTAWRDTASFSMKG